MAPSNKKQHLVILSSPAHPTPAIELGKRLVTTQSAKVTVILSCFDKFVASLSKTIAAIPKTDLFNIILLPPADLSGLVDPTHTGLYAVVSGVRVSKPGFLSAISALETPPTALIVHVYAIECLKIADELKVPKYVYICAHAWYLALIIYTPILDEEVGGEFGDKKEPFLLPGCTPVRPEDLPDPMVVQTRKDYLEFLQIEEFGIAVRSKTMPSKGVVEREEIATMVRKIFVDEEGKKIRSKVKELKLSSEKAWSHGVSIPIFYEVQPTTLAALRDERLLGSVDKAPIFPIGPIIEQGTLTSKSDMLFEWLDKQPNESVLYIAFGSMGKLSLEQMTELAWGLEMSQQRFIWVVRPPKTKPGIDYRGRW
ncbi:hypothetical protein COLO4_22134 [Corchorus olitorius]|uniref:UDP-glucuronosyl/UDP-glucosyltransferase n=1 Tax=Corchorus olitorius TaxID=93759 RepID=A0A1R3INW1_9ROSI|nr:hypothetical protein COLO4_22134 [Corchorus olitorius]